MMFPAEGVPKESGGALFRDIMVLDDVISEVVKELREAGKALRRVTLEWKTIEGKELRETDALELASTEKRHLEPKAPSQRSIPQASLGLASTEKCSLGDQSSIQQCWMFAEEEEGSGTEGICGCAGIRVNDGGGRKQELGEVGLRPGRGERFCGVARTSQSRVNCATRSETRRASSSMILQPFRWRTTASRTLSTSVGTASTSGWQKETNPR